VSDERKVTIVKDPLVIMLHQEDGSVVCHIHPGKLDHRAYGLIICDLVRHVATAFSVHEDDVWEWVDKERHQPTTKITRAS
jgi:hypothetical protein